MYIGHAKAVDHSLRDGDTVGAMHKLEGLEGSKTSATVKMLGDEGLAQLAEQIAADPAITADQRRDFYTEMTRDLPASDLKRIIDAFRRADPQLGDEFLRAAYEEVRNGPGGIPDKKQAMLEVELLNRLNAQLADPGLSKSDQQLMKEIEQSIAERTRKGAAPQAEADL